jgi:hypothetical protein
MLALHSAHISMAGVKVNAGPSYPPGHFGRVLAHLIRSQGIAAPLAIGPLPTCNSSTISGKGNVKIFVLGVHHGGKGTGAGVGRQCHTCKQLTLSSRYRLAVFRRGKGTKHPERAEADLVIKLDKAVKCQMMRQNDNAEGVLTYFG